MFRSDQTAITQNGSALQNVSEFANVAWPVIIHQRLARLARYAGRRPTDRPADFFDEGFGQRDQVVTPLTQRRKVNCKDVEPEVQVLAKMSMLDGLLQIAVGGSDNACISLEHASAAKPLELALLQDAQKLGLRRNAHLGDFIEKEYTA